MDDDDLYYIDHLETLVNLLESSEYKVAYTDSYQAWQEEKNGKFVTKNKALIYSFDFNYNNIFKHNFIHILCLMHTRSCIREVGLFDENLIALEYWDMMIRLSRKFQFAHIPKITCEYSLQQDDRAISTRQKNNFTSSKAFILKKHKTQFLKVQTHQLIKKFPYQIMSLGSQIIYKEQVFKSQIGRLYKAGLRVLRDEGFLAFIRAGFRKIWSGSFL